MIGSKVTVALKLWIGNGSILSHQGGSAARELTFERMFTLPDASHIICQVSHFFLQSGVAGEWKVYYQWGLLVKFLDI